MLIICDDLNLKLGQLRFRSGGSSGGQKGLADIIQHLNTQEFSRLRIGIGEPPGRMDSSDFVLSRFRQEERQSTDEAMIRAADGVECWIQQGIEAAMNRFNTASGRLSGSSPLKDDTSPSQSNRQDETG